MLEDGYFYGNHFISTRKLMNAGMTSAVVGAIGLGLLGWSGVKLTRWGFCSPRHSWGSALKHQMILSVMNLISWMCHRSFLKDSRRAAQVQREILEQILNDNQTTKYGQEWHFHEHITVEAFRKHHPLTTYDHYQSYIEEIYQEGDQAKVLSSYPLVQLAMTSGTSGSRKLLPFTKKQRGVFFLRGIAVIYRQLMAITGTSLQKSCKFMYLPKKRTATCGLPVGPNSSSPEDSKSMMCLFSTPLDGYTGVFNERAGLYVHLLFALKDEYLGQFEANFISILFHAFRFLSAHWKEMSDDIRNGTLNEAYDIPTTTRTSLLRSLGGPDPKRADAIERAFSEGMEGVGTRIWPYLRCILSCNTGPFRLYDEKLAYYLPFSIPRYSPLYAASEGLLGINLEKNSSTYVLVPRAMFFEFIPVDSLTGETEESTLLMDEVQVNHDYELVITNMSGLYRYRMGDVVRVVGFYNTAPLIEFQYRKGQLINLRGEKTSEKSFLDAMSRVNWPGEVMEFTCLDPALVDQQDMPFYSFFVEFMQADTKVSEQERNDLAAQFDDQLCQISPVYLSFREKQSIERPVLHVVRSGTFEQLRQQMIEQGTGITQLKIPRVIRTEAHADTLRKNLLN